MVFIFLAYFTLYNGLQFHPSHENWFKWILFNGWAIFHSVYIPWLPYPFVCWWASRLLPCPGNYKQCCTYPLLNRQTYFFILSYMSSLYTLDVNPLSDILFADIFSHSVGCLFILLLVSFPVQKLFCCPICLLFFFTLVSNWKHITKTCIRELTTYLSSSFVVSCLVFKSLIHLIFVCTVS